MVPTTSSADPDKPVRYAAPKEIPEIPDSPEESPMSQHPSKPHLASRFAFAALLLAAAALTGCNVDSSNQSAEPFHSLLGASSFNGESVSNLGANYTTPAPSHHASHPHEAYTRPTHHAL